MYLKLLCTSLFVSTFAAFAQSPDLDESFGINGRSLISFGTENAQPSSMVIQPDDKILAAGSYYDGFNNQAAITRLNSDGTMDTSFGISGKVLVASGTNLENERNTVKLFADGKIIIVGSVGSSFNNYDFTLLKLNPDGTADTGFGTEGVVISDYNNRSNLAYNAEIQSDNKIVVVGTLGSLTSGNKDFAVSRYNQDGSLDTSFGLGGWTIIDYNTNPSSDNSEDIAFDIAILDDGKILISGEVWTGGFNKFGTARLNSDGSLDTSFGVGGKITTTVDGSVDAVSMEVTPTGKIYLVGTLFLNEDEIQKIALCRLYSDGSLDTSFGNTGKIITDFPNGTSDGFVLCSVLQDDDKLIISGYMPVEDVDYLSIRYNLDGSVDTTFGIDGFLITDLGTVEGAFCSLIQPDGKLVLGGATYTTHNDFSIIRYNSSILTIDEADPILFSIAPNPFVNSVNISANLNFSENFVVSLSDMNGRNIPMKSSHINLGPMQNGELVFDESLSKGLYILTITGNSGKYQIKLLK